MTFHALLAVAFLFAGCTTAAPAATGAAPTGTGAAAAASAIPATTTPTDVPPSTAPPATILDELPIVLTSTTQRFKVPKGRYEVAWSVAPGPTTDCRFAVLALPAGLSTFGPLFTVTLVGHDPMTGSAEADLLAETYALRHSEYDDNSVDDCVRDWSATITAK